MKRKLTNKEKSIVLSSIGEDSLWFIVSELEEAGFSSFIVPGTMAGFGLNDLVVALEEVRVCK